MKGDGNFQVLFCKYKNQSYFTKVQQLIVTQVKLNWVHCSNLIIGTTGLVTGGYTLYCYDVKIKLPYFTVLKEVGKLYAGSDEKLQNFRVNIHQYNNAISFVSLGAKVDLSRNYGSHYF